jgi:hypothetical protein
MRWVMAAVLVIGSLQAAHAALIDPTTGVMVDPTTDPMDYVAVASGQPGDIGSELAAQAEEQAEQAAADAAAQAAADAQAAAQAAMGQ